jgi:tRNA (guanine-N7-)-methyltransferase
VGRRALRKIDPSLDLSEHLLEFAQLPRPWSAAAIFGRHPQADPLRECPARPLEIEVGSGKGLFLRNAARCRPDVDFLGIEIAHKYARFAAAGLAKAGLPNGRVVSGNALRIFAELVPDGSLAAVHVYFPDPWWKKRHRKRRVMNETFLQHVERTLLPGGALHFWTDVEEYFQATLELLAARTRLIGPMAVPETPAEHDLAYRTHFERRMRLSNEPVFRAEFRKMGA